MSDSAKAKIDSIRQNVIELSSNKTMFFQDSKKQKYGIAIAYQYPEDRKLIYELHRGSTVKQFDQAVDSVLNKVPLPPFIQYEVWSGLSSAAKRLEYHRIDLIEKEEIKEKQFIFPEPETHTARMASGRTEETLGQLESKIREELEQKALINELRNDLAKSESENSQLKDDIALLEEENDELASTNEKVKEEAKKDPIEFMKGLIPLAGILFPKIVAGIAGLPQNNGAMASLEPDQTRSAQLNLVSEFINKLNDAQLSEFLLIVSIMNNETGYINLIASQLKTNRSL
jgi:molybdopterin converting factor small subunit